MNYRVAIIGSSKGSVQLSAADGGFRFPHNTNPDDGVIVVTLLPKADEVVTVNGEVTTEMSFKWDNGSNRFRCPEFAIASSNAPDQILKRGTAEFGWPSVLCVNLSVWDVVSSSSSQPD